LLPAALALSLLALLFAGSTPAGLMVVVLLVLGLILVVFAHRRLPRRARKPGEWSSLRTPRQVGMAVLVAAVFGGAIGVLVSIMFAAVASSLAGDGSLLIRLCVGVFALVPCIAVGSRCGQWWAFLGASALIPILALCVLLSNGPAERRFGLAFLSVVSIAFAVAAGSLNRELARRRRSSTRERAGSARQSIESSPHPRHAAVSASG
jgi:hypothetical protein